MKKMEALNEHDYGGVSTKRYYYFQKGTKGYENYPTLSISLLAM
jgi:hypothetical protein